MRKLALIGATAALWLFVAALPALADGGPHRISVNSGSAGISADSCAGCHRAHTATAANLLNSDQPEICLNCHDGSKAATDVVNGVQYSASAQTEPVLGALRGGGFQYALIDSGNTARYAYALSPYGLSLTGKVGPLATGAQVTSTHGGTGGIYSAGWGTGTVWGNGANGSGTGATVTLECGSCHNPHGNGQYRILQVKPSLTATSGTFTLGIASGIKVTDTTTTGPHNYTIRPATNGADANGSAGAIVAGTTGDYWRYKWDPTGTIPWSTGTGLAADPMNTGWNGTNLTPANNQGAMTAWCVTCHTRYNGMLDANGKPSSLSTSNPTSDADFMYKHGTTRVGCAQCHVSHGSNAMMTGTNSLNFTDPANHKPPTVTISGVTSGDSRLLKINNRGTCQMCHDPTGSLGVGAYTGPAPTPGN